MDFFVAQDIVKRYADQLALDKVGINVKEGTIFGLLGPNGAGKTTLIRIINQITAPDEGQVYFAGEKLKNSHVDQIGYLPEERGLYKKMKIGEQALYLAQLKGISRTDALKKLKYWFEKFEIQSWWDKKVEELSKGMQQKVQFIITVLHSPKLLIFDEPFSGFDPINASLMKDEILNLKKQGSTIIFSTHNMSSVEELCDDIALIDKGRTILKGDIKDIKKTYKTNIFEVSFQGDLDKLKNIAPEHFSVDKMSSYDHTLTAQIRILNSLSTNELLTHIMKCGNIISFNEIVPSMNDIFIKVVGENK